MTSLRKIFRAFGLRRCAAAAVLAAVAITGCSREDTPAGSRVGEAVLVRLPGISVASPVEVVPDAAGTRGLVPQDVAPCAAASEAAPDGGSASGDGAGELFGVTLGARPAEGAGPDRGTAGSAEDSGTVSAAGGSASPATRADVALTNVWVFQFDASGTAVRCEKVDALAAGDPLEVVLSSGEDYTLGVVAGGPASGLSTSNIPDLAAFREEMLFTSSVASLEEVPYAGTLSGVRVLANGQVQVGGSYAEVPTITLRRCMAQVTIDLTYSVADYALDGVELYNVPVGASFAPDRAAAEFPLGTDASFGYRDNTAAGLAPHATNGGRYTWYIGQNRRGSGTGITEVQDKNSSKAPAYATYARVRTHSTTEEDAPLYYDIYLGEDMLSDFNVTANHVYSYTARITGSAEAHYSLLDTDGRVSGKKPQHIKSAAVTPAGDIPGQGDTYSVTLTGVLPAAGVEVRANISGAEPVTGKVTASGTAVTLAVPANMSYNERSVWFEYLWKDSWIKIEETSRTQLAWHVDKVSHDAPETISHTGGTYTVTFEGWGDYQVRAMSGGTQVGINTTVKDDPTKTVCTHSITVDANTGAARPIRFQYRFKGNWLDIDPAVNQAAAIVTGVAITPDLSNFSIAPTTFTVTLSGYLGSGIPFEVIALDDGEKLASFTVTKPDTGVSFTISPNKDVVGDRTVVFRYFENGQWKECKRAIQYFHMSWQEAIAFCSSKGNGWRLPTHNELIYYWCIMPSADEQLPDGEYWTGTLNGPSHAMIVRPSNGETSGVTSTDARTAVHCVKDN